MKLTEKERQQLANFYDSDTYRVYKKHFMELRQMEIAQESVFAQDMKHVHNNQGRVMELKYMDQELRKIHKDQEKRGKA